MIKYISLENYLLELVKFIYDYLIRFPEFYPSIKKKKVCFEIFNTSKRIYRTLDIQNKLIVNDDKCHKKFVIPSSLFNALYDKKIVFENLYTGYESVIMRYRNDEYKRDILDDESLIVTIEAGNISSWKKYSGNKGVSIGINKFGESAPYKEIYEHLNLSVEKIVLTIQDRLRN